MKRCYAFLFSLLLLSSTNGLELAAQTKAGERPMPLIEDVVSPPQIEGTGGPDAFGYRWIDSDEPGGPAYAYTDISGTGTQLTLLPTGGFSPNDEGQALVNLPFDVKYYGQTKSAIQVSSNGFITFDVSFFQNSFGNIANIPNPNIPNDLIAPFFGDLDASLPGAGIFTQQIGNRFIIQWNAWGFFGGGGQQNMDFQIILYENSSTIEFVYEDVTQNNRVVGIENSTGTIGLPIANFNQAYTHDQLLVRIAAEADIAVSKTGVNYGPVFLGFTKADTLTVSNIGGDSLIVSNITSDHSDFSVDVTSFLLNSGESQDVIVTFAPTTEAVISGTLSIFSNDPLDSLVTISLQGEGQIAPAIFTTPEVIDEKLAVGVGDNKRKVPLVINNTGGLPLTFSFPDFAALELTQKAVLDGTEGFGGPDAFGYRWIDSDEQGGPFFNWVDISGVGTAANLTDDDFIEVPLPFTFFFYNQAKDTVKISSNGYLTFGTDGNDPTDDAIPNQLNTPHDFIAPFWDDLDPSAGGTIHYYFDEPNNRFVVQYTNIPRASVINPGTYTFQVILNSDFSISYQYLNVSGYLIGQTIGVENDNGTIGLEIAHNESYVHDSLAIQISTIPDWISVEPTSGVVAGMSFFTTEVTLDATGLPGGEYQTLLLINNNSLENPQLRVAVRMTVSRPPVRDQEISDYTINEDDGTFIVADLDTIFSDPDADTLTYSTTIDGGGLTTGIDTAGVLSFSTVQDSFGVFQVVVTAQDEFISVRDTFVVTINPVNDPPVLTLPDIVFDEDDSSEVKLNLFVLDVDHEDSEISFDYNILTATAEISTADLIVELDSATNIVILRATPDSSGIFTLEFTATDDSGASDIDTMTVTVNPVNDAPFRTGLIADQVVAEDNGTSEVVPDITTFFDDVDNLVLTYDVSVTGGGITAGFNGNALEISTVQDSFGVYPVIVSASDSEFAATDTFIVTVQSVNDAPVLSLPDVEFNEDGSFQLGLNGFVTDVDHDTTEISFASSVLTAMTEKTGFSVSPGGKSAIEVMTGDLDISIDPVTNIATFSATPDSFGLFTARFIATDDSGATDDDTISVTVNPVNDAPTVLNPLADAVLLEDFATFTYADLDTVFNDIDAGDNLTYSVLVSQGVITANLTGGRFLQLASVPDAFGSDTVRVTATDVSLEAVTDVFVVTVNNVNDPPVVVSALPDLNVDEDFGTLDVADLDTVFGDIDPGDALSYQVSSAQGIVSAQILGGNTLRLTSVPDANGSDTLTVTATDLSLAQVVDVVFVTVNNVNDAPVVANAMPDTTVDEDFAPFVYRDLDAVFNDIDPGDNLSYSVSTALGIVSASISGGRFLNISAIPDANGTDTITVIATDLSSAQTSDIMLIVVNNTNDPPTVASPIADLTVDEDFGTMDVADLDTVFNDIDPGDALSYQVSTAQGIVSAQVFGGNTLRLTSVPDANGADTITVIATDLSSAQAIDIVLIMVNNVNDAPVVVNAMPDTTVDEDFSPFVYRDLDAVFNDIDPGDDLSYSVSSALGIVSPSISGGRFLDISAIPDANGTDTITVTATDLSFAQVTDVMLITVNNVNDAPTVINALSDLSIDEDFGLLDAADLDTVFNDIDPGDALSYQVSAAQGIVSAQIFGGSTLRLTSVPDANGADTITVIATDLSSAQAIDIMLIMVNNVNDAPVVVNAIPDTTVSEDFSPFTYRDLDTVFDDIDPGDNLSYSVSTSLGIVSASISGGSLLDISAIPDANGTDTITVTATDLSFAEVSDVVVITVNNTNDPPTVASPIADVMVDEDFATFTLVDLDTVFDDIDPGDNLSYSVSTNQNLLNATVIGGNLLQLSSIADLNGTDTITVIATDLSLAAVTDVFRVTINNTNDPPFVVTALPDTAVDEDFATFSYVDLDPLFGDIDPGDVLSFSVSVKNGLIDANVITGNVLELVSVPDAVGTDSVFVTATDLGLETVTSGFEVTISNTNDPPIVIGSLVDQSLQEDFGTLDIADLDTVFDDIDPGDALSYQVSTAQGIVSAQIFGGNTLRLTSVPDANGADTITVIATDLSSAQAIDIMLIMVNNVNDAPIVVSAISDISIGEDFSPFTAADLDTVFDDIDPGDILSYSASSSAGIISAAISGGRFLDLTSIPDANGADTITVVATDLSSAQTTDIMVILVNNMNDAPIVADPLGAISVPEGLTDFFVADLNQVFSDVDLDALGFSVSAGGDVTGSISGDSLFISAMIGFIGTDLIIVTATDDSAASVIDTLTVTTTNLNFPPTVQNAIPDQLIDEDAQSVFAAVLNDVFFDIDGDALAFGVVSSGNVTGTISGDSLFLSAMTDFVGSDTAFVTAIDDSGASAVDTFVVTVQPVNDPPSVVSGIDDQVVAEDFGTAFVAVLSDVFSDIDGDPLVFDADPLGAGLSSIISGDSLFLISVQNFNGLVLVRATASDSLETAADTFSVVVNSVNDPPVLSGIPDIIFGEDEVFVIGLNAFVADIDHDTTRIDFGASVLTATEGMAGISIIRKKRNLAHGLDETVNAPLKSGTIKLPAAPSPGTFIEVDVNDLVVSIDSMTHIATFTSTSDSSGTFEVRFIATDDSGAADSDTIRVTVTPVNDAPVVATPIPDSDIDEDSGPNQIISDLYTFFADVDSDALLFSAAADSGLNTTIADSSLTVEPLPDFFGSVEVIVTGSDGLLAAADTFTVNVLNINDSPVAANLVSPADGDTLASLAAPIPFSWTPSSDIDGDSLEYSLRLFNAGFDSTISGISDTAFSFAGDGLLDPSETFSWTVLVTDGLVVVASPDTFVFTTPDSIVGIGDNELLPQAFALHQNYPNPFNPSTTIKYDLPAETRVVVRIYNLLGQLVATLADEVQPAGFRLVKWDGRNRFGHLVSSGVYIYRIEAESFVKSRKMMFLK